VIHDRVWRRIAGADTATRPGLPFDEALAPVPLLCLVVLVINDRVLKASVPGALTGKLSDLAGLAVAPLVLTAAVDTLLYAAARLGAPVDWTLRRWKLIAAIGATAAVFVAVKVWSPASTALADLLAAIFGQARIVTDPTDLFTLPALAVAWWHGRRTVAQIPHGRVAWAARSGAAEPFADAVAAGDLARGAGRQELQLRALATQAAVRSEAGDVAGSMALSQEVLVMARRIGDRRREGICLANLGEGWVDLGEARRGHECFTAALQIFVDIGDRACEGDCRVNIGRALLALGRGDEAVAMLERAAEMCASTSRVEYEGIAYMLLGEAHEQQAATSEARDDFARAVALFTRIELNLRWRAELGLARTLAELGDIAGARDAADRAHAQLTQQRTRLARGTDPAALDAALAQADALRLGDEP
jgi:tetratricopeptide (TPR) repeat protein